MRTCLARAGIGGGNHFAILCAGFKCSGRPVNSSIMLFSEVVIDVVAASHPMPRADIRAQRRGHHRMTDIALICVHVFKGTLSLWNTCSRNTKRGRCLTMNKQSKPKRSACFTLCLSLSCFLLHHELVHHRARAIGGPVAARHRFGPDLRFYAHTLPTARGWDKRHPLAIARRNSKRNKLLCTWGLPISSTLRLTSLRIARISLRGGGTPQVGLRCNGEPKAVFVDFAFAFVSVVLCCGVCVRSLNVVWTDKRTGRLSGLGKRQGTQSQLHS